jgi:lipoate-protein ligase A
MGSGAYHMALDAYLAENPTEVPLLRFYSWEPFAVSIGYNQAKRIRHINTHFCDALGVDVVMRPTGGRAVFHATEITYSVVIPPGCPLFDLSVHELYRTISDAIRIGLRSASIETDIERNKLTGAPNHFGEMECFASAARFELRYNGKKIVGSAQRRTASGILQHGSILLRDVQHVIPSVLGTESAIGNFTLDELVQSAQPLIPDCITRDKIIDALILGFEITFGCTWKTGNIGREFRDQQKHLTEKMSIYKSRSQQKSMAHNQTVCV